MGPGPERYFFAARGNNGWGPGTTVNLVNTQFSNLGRLSWPKRDEIIACLNFLPFLHFCNSEYYFRKIFWNYFLSNRENDPEQFFGLKMKIKMALTVQNSAGKIVREPSKRRGSDLDGSTDLLSPGRVFYFRNWEPNFEFSSMASWQ